MPGFSENCITNQHSSCNDSGCRCSCHRHTQELIAKAEAQKSQAAPVAQLNESLTVICPKCGAKQRATDLFCRKDGERLPKKLICLECGTPGELNDVFCFMCGTKHGERRAVEIPAEPVPAESEILVDRIAELLASGGKVEVS